MHDRNRILGLSLGAILLFAAAAPAAMAGCGTVPAMHKSAYLAQPGADAGLVQLASYTDAPTMVGLWSVKFVSQGTQIDFGYSQWHSDGTEFLNSGSRAPATQNYCLGVWKQVGLNAFKLNHWALSYDTSGNLNANVNIKERVKLDRGGNGFAGTFSIQAYDPSTGDPLGPETDGDITGTRITVD